ncbi:MAG TPA: S41 family peptidase [Blastocatellia bacterium]|nr:S41 family peptidase [Blastocatellia bacterium]
MTRSRLLLAGVALCFILNTGGGTHSIGAAASGPWQPFYQSAPAYGDGVVAGQARDAAPPARGLENWFVAHETAGSLFENVVAVLQSKYYDKKFVSDFLPKLVEDYKGQASKATTLEEQREVVESFLSHVPASHLGLLSTRTHKTMMYELQDKPYPSFGFQLVNLKGKFYSHTLLEGGPAQKAGLLTGDRVVTIDNTPVEKSARLDWRSDDAYLSDELDPPVHNVIAEAGDKIALKVERTPGKFVNITVAADDYCAFMAAKASARVIQSGSYKLGYIHFWFIHMSGLPEMLKEKLDGEFQPCDALILDLRGRGGSATALQKILDVLRSEHSNRKRPVIALFDHQSRSAKDVIAYELKRTGLARLVGEPTAGAVIPATFADVGHESILMFPSFKLPRYTDILEFHPVEPDVRVEKAGPLSAGRDPILEGGIAEAVRLLKQAGQPAAAVAH